MFEISIGQKITERIAVKGVYYNEKDALLLVKTNRGDYKLPGGGMAKGETAEEALRREFLEETGYSLVSISHQMGRIEEVGPDRFDDTAIFFMKIHVYACEIDESCQVPQQLDAYEAKLAMQPVFVDVQTAYQTNMALLKEDPKTQNPWLQRETAILQKLCSCT